MPLGFNFSDRALEEGYSETKLWTSENALVYTLYRKSPLLKQDNLSTKDKQLHGPEGVLIKRFHCI